jgi:hypothetical protein
VTKLTIGQRLRRAWQGERGQKVRRLLGKVRRLARRVVDPIPLSPLGLLVAVGSVLCWFYMGGERLDEVLTVVSQVGAGLVVLTVVSVSLASLRLWRLVRREYTGEVPRTEADQPTMTGFTGPSLRFTPLVRISWSWEAPSGFQVSQAPLGGRLVEQVVADRRGLHEGVVRRFVVEDSLGLSRVAFRVGENLAGTFRILPSLGLLRQSAIVATLAGGDELPHPLGTLDGDRLELRRYGHGDPARLIVWKIFGRTRKLIVRQPERALARAHSVAAYLVTGASDEPAAAAARVAVETGALGLQWVLGADGVARDAHREDQALELIAASGGEHEMTEGAGLANFIARNERQGTVRYLVFGPAHDGEWVDRVAAIASRRRGMLDVVIVGDGVGRPAAGRWLRLVLREPAERGVNTSEIERILRRLASIGVQVAVIDRPSGKLVNPALWSRSVKVA